MQTNFIIKNKNPRIKSLGDNTTSHHTMGAFFSGQDMKMVQQEGNDTNCFVSLVVDTKGTYVAIVTRKINIQAVYAITVTNRTYEFFGEGSKEIPLKEGKDGKDVKVTNKEVIEYSDLEVERHVVPEDLGYKEEFKYLDERFEEIEAKKAEERKKQCRTPYLWNNWEEGSFFDDFYRSRHSKSKFTEKQEDNSYTSLDVEWEPSPVKIHRAIVHMLTCNLILNPEKINLRQWVTLHMFNMYKKIFGKGCIEEVLGDGGIGAFGNWRDFIVQHTLDYFDYSDVPDSLMDNFDLAQSSVAKALMNELERYSIVGGTKDRDSNPFIESYMDVLSCYIIE